ncbi:MAG: peptide chain release factor N(5)-glutamine methyltransferase [Bacteroidales bacterium]|nr:peptide chain release factor N(5)-glutamine methyltransferase [Bacteroidales bacterium]
MRIPSNRLNDVLKFAKSELSPFYDEKEILSFYYLLCEHYLHLNKTKVILNADLALSESELLKFNFAIKDLKTEKPIQYILGETEFCDLQFKVNEHTLIPRPETEELVYWILEKENKTAPLHILDIGTGSGCIPISLATHWPLAKIKGIDISAEALDLAKFNNKCFNTAVQFEQIDILNPPASFDFMLDIIVSNPPYVLESEKTLMKKNVLSYEPALALFVKDDDPLLFYKKIIHFADNQLISGGRLYFEINENLGIQLIALLKAYSYKQIELKNDIHEKARMICAIKN